MKIYLMEVLAMEDTLMTEEMVSEDLVERIQNEGQILEKTIESAYRKRLNESLRSLEGKKLKSCQAARKKNAEFNFKIQIEHVKRVFNEFHVLSISAVRMGHLECNYGKQDFFRNALWIHTHEVQEIVEDVKDDAVFSEFCVYNQLLQELKNKAKECKIISFG